jgi:putative transposase
MSFFQRRLPQWRPDGRPLFLTWSLSGALPHRLFPPPHPTGNRAFIWIDRCLDEARFGPHWLHRAEIAQIVVSALRYADETLRYFDLHAYVVMPNHVHTLLTPLTRPDKLAQSLKGFSGHHANRLLARTGGPFWQRASHEYRVRSRSEFERIRGYIERDPVQAGLARAPEEYPWSSAYRPAREIAMPS